MAHDKERSGTRAHRHFQSVLLRRGSGRSRASRNSREAKIPQELVTKNIWRERFEDIAAFEKYLARNGTLILKFFLNVSKEEQRQRFLDRLEEPSKNWKFSLADVSERKLWDKYQAAYQDILRHTSAKHAPWHVVPADHKWFARVVISSTIVSAMEKLNLRFPEVEKSMVEELKKVRGALEQEEQGVAPATKKRRRMGLKKDRSC